MEKHFNAKLQCLIVFLFHIKSQQSLKEEQEKFKSSQRQAIEVADIPDVISPVNSLWNEGSLLFLQI
jgi:hypothetical protein